jgi:DNA-binding response OmpR family regulator
MMGATMLIVEDELDIGYVLRANFKKDGYNVLAARTAESGLKLAREHDPAIVLLDIMLPGMDGLEMLRELRRLSQAPVLLLTAKEDEIDRILGLKLGADDYVTKPFSLDELSLRVKAILGRFSRSDGAADGLIRVGGVEVDVERHETRVNGRAMKLTPREFDLLRLLIDAKGKVLSREQLARGLWGDERSQEMDLRLVDQHVARLRGKLASERRLIATVSRSGYRIKTDAAASAPSRRKG